MSTMHSQLEKIPYELLTAEEINNISSDIHMIYDWLILEERNPCNLLCIPLLIKASTLTKLIDLEVFEPPELSKSNAYISIIIENLSDQSLPVISVISVDNIPINSKETIFLSYEKKTIDFVILQSSLSLSSIASLYLNTNGNMFKIESIYWGW